MELVLINNFYFEMQFFPEMVQEVFFDNYLYFLFSEIH